MTFGARARLMALTCLACFAVGDAGLAQPPGWPGPPPLPPEIQDALTRRAQMPPQYRSQQPSTTESLRYNVVWAKAPSYDTWAAAYPKTGAGKAGGVVLRCRIETSGVLTGCRTEVETPQGLGFGAAAIGLSRYFVAEMKKAEAGKYPSTITLLNIAFPAELASGAKPFLPTPQTVSGLSPALIAGAFPAGAAAAGLTTGQTYIRCARRPDGGMADCRVISETPAGQGFGEAGLMLASAARFTIWSTDGRPTASEAAMYLQFDKRLAR